MEVIDIQAVKDCLAEVSDCEDKQYAIALLEWAIGKRTFDLAEHDSELLDKVAEKLKTDIEKYWYRSELDMSADNVNCLIDEDIEDLKAEVEKC